MAILVVSSHIYLYQPNLEPRTLQRVVCLYRPGATDLRDDTDTRPEGEYN